MKKQIIAATMMGLAGIAGSATASAQAAPPSATPAAVEALDLDFLDATLAGVEATPAPSATPAPAASNDAPLEVIPLPRPTPGDETRAAPVHRQRMVEEIVVTAQRKEESLQEVPISITVFNQEQLANANITNAGDISLYTPSLSTNSRFGSENASFSIRGFTQNMRTTASVATYMAEVVAPRGQSLQTSGDGAGPGSLFDLQNVQVLKGPQGTLFGRNTTGGAILLVPQRPTDAYEGYVELSGGDFEARRIQAVANLPVSDELRLRFGVDRNQRDGYFRNFTGIGSDEFGNVDYTAARASAVWDITDALENYTILSYVNSETYGNTARMFDCNPSPLPNNNLLFAITGVACQAQLRAQEAAGRNGYYDVVSTIATPITKLVEKRLINTTTWTLSDNFSVKNIIGYAHLSALNASDIFGTQFHAPFDVDPRRELKIGLTLLAPGLPTTSQQTFVEEFRLQGLAFDQRLDWQTGLYFENSRPDGFSGYRSMALISCEMASLEGDPSNFNCFDPLAGAVGNVRTFQVKTEYLNRAAYAQAKYRLSEQFSVTAGLRYTWDNTEAYGVIDRSSFVGTVPLPVRRGTTSPEVSSKAPTGQIEFSYRPVEDLMTYAKYVRGYRQGSVNTAADPGVDTFTPEKVDMYEIGAKSSWDGAVPGRFSVAAFYNDFTDMQLETGYLSRDFGSTTTIFNAGRARIAGVEAEATFTFFEVLRLSLSYSHLDTKLLEAEDHTLELIRAGGLLGGLVAAPAADQGDTLPFAPDDTLVTSLNYALPLAEDYGTIDLGVTHVYTGKQRTTASSVSPYDELDPIRVLNLNANWRSIWGSSLDLALFATNLLDEEYDTYHTGTYNELGFESRQVGAPRMFGGRLKYNFGADR